MNLQQQLLQLMKTSKNQDLRMALAGIVDDSKAGALRNALRVSPASDIVAKYTLPFKVGEFAFPMKMLLNRLSQKRPPAEINEVADDLFSKLFTSETSLHQMVIDLHSLSDEMKKMRAAISQFRK